MLLDKHYQWASTFCPNSLSLSSHDALYFEALPIYIHTRAHVIHTIHNCLSQFKPIPPSHWYFGNIQITKKHTQNNRVPLNWDDRKSLVFSKPNPRPLSLYNSMYDIACRVFTYVIYVFKYTCF